MSTQHETKQDQLREALVALQFVLYCNERRPYELAAVKVEEPEKVIGPYPDYKLIRDGETVGYIEVKCRPGYTRNRIERLGGAMINTDKYEALRDCGFPCVVIHAFDDDWVYHDITDPVTEGYGGRTDRGDPNDLGPRVYFDPATMKSFYKPEEKK